MFSKMLPSEKNIIFKAIQSKQQRKVLQTLKPNITNKLDEYSFANNCVINWNTFGSDIVGYYEFVIIYFSPYCELTVTQITKYIIDLIYNEIKNISVTNVNQYSEFISKQLIFPDLVNYNNEIMEEIELKKIKADILEYLNSEYDCEFKFRNENSLGSVIIETSSKKIEDGSPVFMGHGFQIEERMNITQYICIKIFEKMLGENESSSVYFKLRDQGSIYTAITQFFFEQQYFITGIFTTYDSQKAQNIDGIDFNKETLEKKFTIGKRLLTNEVIFSRATSEYPFYSMSFNIVNSSELSVNDLIYKINHIGVEDMQFLLKKLKPLCFEVIQ